MRKNATVHVLTITTGEYEDTTPTIVGIVSDKRTADAFAQAGFFHYSHDIEVLTLNNVDAHWRKMIDAWLDPAQNPLCECGHRLLHHRSGKKRSCKHNSEYQHNRHKCKEFRLAKSQTSL